MSSMIRLVIQEIYTIGRSIDVLHPGYVCKVAGTVIDVKCSRVSFYRKSLVAGLMTGTASISDELDASGSGGPWEPVLGLPCLVIPLAPNDSYETGLGVS